MIEKAAEAILRGDLVAFPTETVYGLGASLWNEEGIAKIFRAKGRPADNPLIVHFHSVEQIQQVAQDIPSALYALAERFWPGPLTCILKRRSCVPDSATAGLETVAVRIPSHPVALALLKAVGEPLVAPSANLSGKPSPTRAEHVWQDLEGKVADVLDGGACEVGVESTVINLCEEIPVILRPGVITKEELEEVLGPVKIAVKGERAIAPGMKYRHYAPICPVHLVRSLCAYSKEDGKKRLFLGSSEAPGISRLETRTLYQLLRKADAEGYDEVVVQLDSKLESDVALMNRLLKAAEPR